MRPLKRPMFRTGGPIKEGLMNGLKDGGPATYMADATMMAGGGMPNMRGRVTGPGGYAGKPVKENFLNKDNLCSRGLVDFINILKHFSKSLIVVSVKLLRLKPSELIL